MRVLREICPDLLHELEHGLTWPVLDNDLLVGEGIDPILVKRLTEKLKGS